MEEQKEIITLVDEEGAQLEFLVLDYFNVEDLDYAILLPFDESRTGNESEIMVDDENVAMDNEGLSEEDISGEDADISDVNGDAVIFRVEKGNNGETMLHVIEDDEEWEKVAEIAYGRLFADEKGHADEEEER